MVSDRFIEKEDPQADQVLEWTKSGQLNWRNAEFSEPSWACWKIGFKAETSQREYIVEKEHLLTTGGWVTEVKTTLTIRDKSTGQISVHVHISHDDYVECLYEAGYPGVSSLSRFLIDQFRPPMNLHWSIM